MMEQFLLEPIELTDVELYTVAGGLSFNFKADFGSIALGPNASAVGGNTSAKGDTAAASFQNFSGTLTV